MARNIFDPEVQGDNLPGKIVVGLERMAEAFRVLLWEHAKVIGLSPIQIQILIFVKYHDRRQCHVSHLAKEFNVTKPTISDAVRVLELKSLITKHSSVSDKRAYAVELTILGLDLVDQTEHFARPIQSSIEDLPEKDQEHFFAVLSKVIYNMNRAGVLSTQRMCFNCKYYDQQENQPYCQLIKTVLTPSDIRLDCPEFEQ